MKEVIADKDYFFDAEGNVTTDESVSARWLAREGAAVLPDFQEALTAFQESSKVAQPKEEKVKADKPAADKKAEPSENKAKK